MSSHYILLAIVIFILLDTVMTREIRLISLVNSLPIQSLSSEEIGYIIVGFLRFAYKFGRVVVERNASDSMELPYYHQNYQANQPFIDLQVIVNCLMDEASERVKHVLITQYQVLTGQIVNHYLPILLDQFGILHLVESIIILLPDNPMDPLAEAMANLLC